ncbi:disulfide bond formation protein B [Manganibacter manganicus]|nr:disulfide bond formation protein B [Pseudaminobacter manganicus]
MSALAVALGMGVAVGTAIGFEKIGGYIPCMLCLQQRIPYYVGIPIMVVTLVLALFRFPAVLTRGLLVAGGVLMLYSLYLGSFHAGVEWGWWTGPHDCGVVVAPDTGDGVSGILDAINTIIPPSCDTAALRVLGLSFAGWNAVTSMLLAAVAFRGAFARG